MLDFTGQIVLVTGASQGIGLGIAKGFRQAGATVHITGTRSGPDRYEDDLSDFQYHQADLSQPAVRGAIACTASGGRRARQQRGHCIG